MEELVLSGKQKSYLRSLGSTMEPVVQIGKTGVSETVLESTVDVLLARELIKVKVLRNCAYEPKEALQELALASGAALVQVIGRNGLLYKPSLDPEKKRKIELP